MINDKRRKDGNNSTAAVRKYSFFVEIMKALLTYVGAIVLQYCTNFVEARITDIVEDIMSTAYMRNPTCAIHIRYIPFLKILMKRTAVLP